jgi:CDP-diacylglycerol---glycerol-3-phosphate 3-phosphatidyltransferase
MRMNLPNQITVGRLALAVIFVALLSWFDASKLAAQRWLLNLCFWVFLAAALTDILDGLLARMMKSVTSFGRIVDPVVDKVMVCGAFVVFAGHPFWDGPRAINISGVDPWMVVVILFREFLVSAVRAHAEAAGVEFGASWIGKLKMFVQSATVCVILGQLAWQLDGLEPLRLGSIWLTLIVTAVSTVPYVHRARRFLLTSAALGVAPTAEEAAAAQAAGTPEHSQP